MVIKSGSNGLRRYAITGSRVKNAHSHADDDHHDEDEEEEDMSQEGREREELGGHGTGEMPEMNMNRLKGEGEESWQSKAGLFRPPGEC